MNQKKEYYNKYSEYLNTKYSEKIYKLPINLPITCPNRTDGHGCTFCAEVGTGFEALPSNISVTQQLEKTKLHIEKKYNAHKFIAYFQNYTNTYMPIKAFLNYMTEAASYPDIVAISISTRPDCISADYLEILKSIKEQYHIDINIELGLQTVNYHTLSKINRGHGLAEFIDAVLQIQRYDFSICCHIILNLPYDSMEDTIETAKIISALHIDIVKIHSLYIAKNTLLCEAYENGTITMCSKEEYIHRLINFLEFLDPKIIIERLFSRIPESEAVFSNWGTSWWKLQDLLIETMEKKKSYQGKKFCYLNGKALKDLT
ncbi:TIGR01212 family radical SAM protein [Lachnospiraceae bacterium LCP25S3_G4]